MPLRTRRRSRLVHGMPRTNVRLAQA